MRLLARLALVLLTSLLTAAASQTLAGTVSIAWDPVSVSDLAGYRVYYGTSPGNYTQSVDVGNVTSTTINNLTDCTTYYFGVKAYDTAANESVAYSNEISGWPRPVVTLAAPSAAEQGRALALTITGSNFQSGASVVFSATGITVNSVTVNSCTQITANITVGNTATVGASNIEVANPDLVFGTGTGLLTVQLGVAPTVASTTPSNGAVGISIAVDPTVTFSEPMLASTITSATVRLINASGTAITQAAGSPTLSADGLTATINPAANLTAGAAYRIQVVGGASGAKDLANRAVTTTFTQATGFTTAADTTGPAISAITETGVGSTAATVGWTTDEASDSQLFYRKQGTTAYQQTALDATLVTTHSVTLTGLTPSTTYDYYVESSDAAGNTTQSAVGTFATSANTFTYLRMEAEAGTLVAPVRSQSGTGVFGNSYIDVPAGTPNGSATSPAGTATFGVNIPTSGTWYLWVRMYGPDANSDSWYESVNGAARQAIVASPLGAWTWRAGRSYTLSPGLASIELGGFNANGRVDRVLLTNDATFVPSEQPVGDQTPPGAVTAFAGVGGVNQIALSWTNPSSTDFTQTVIRVRTDGKFPTSPLDGTAVTVEPNTPGSADTFTHTGLSSGVTYYYSAFSIDSSGNVGAKATLQALASDTTPPGAVNNLRRTDKH
ncbi:MAG TPA: fibronectin type III domain-containing protein [Candidatus Polarisedimenticolaceae bacterium]|nr:fibronectin type III domain-containing protein [Candidatus Polarisedimenticolaceae bacterium]